MGLFLLGVFLMFLAFFLEMARRGEGGGGERAEAGGVVIIGPVPIVFGSSQRITKAVLILAIALTVLVLALYLLLYWY
ncbi:hypothetical protein TUZN_1513 [Thermoproteus uzoniensis 768-20]|uniref:DUF131 domain-containing protein n=2 Tax=Thermoproteus TaxID=2270 RepID=F2L257_THEU7|nr:hypothetical protein TUZN_1513 [Thermoproteus uzoniensis 768-20]